MSPPIIWQNRRLMASPSPVPPYLRVVDASAWTNSWNSLPICSRRHADAGVGDRDRHPFAARPRVARFDANRDRAVLGELAGVAREIEQRLPDPHLVGAHRCRCRRRSRRPPGCRSSPPACRCVAPTSATSGAMAKASTCSSILPASILERSRMSLISASRCRPARSTRSSGSSSSVALRGRARPRAASR